jgi:hypothetical protein
MRDRTDRVPAAEAEGTSDWTRSTGPERPVRSNHRRFVQDPTALARALQILFAFVTAIGELSMAARWVE